MNLDTYLFATIAVIILGLGVWGYVEREHVATLTAQNAQLSGDVKACKDANSTDEQTIKSLQGANQKYADETQASSSAAAAAVSDAQAAKAQLSRTRASLAAQAAAGAAVPECAAFLAVDLAKACPAVAASVKGAAQ
jgi:hypothetical protein